ncbi:MAG: glycine cleavage T C-terminal barrel domain-containing protein [Acidimicrobiia bacterium]|nr:glycine cleavage T C-terminal barrel domain-containing protein [Acidimicrobiia bacterium]
MSDASFGDVTAEYLAIRRGAGLVSGSHEAVRVVGPDAISFLQGLLSQDLSGPAGTVVRSLLLTPQGKLRALLWALIGEGEVVLIADAGSGETVASDLGRYRIRVDVEIERERSPVLELWGPASAGVLERAGISAPGGWRPFTGGWVARAGLAGLDRYLLTGVDPARLLTAGAVRCGQQAATAVRIEAGEPVMGADVDESTIPQESGLVPEAVSFTKGCYLGQELVARIDSRGHVNRRLRGLVVEENLLPPRGAAVFSGDREVGLVGSVAESLTLRAPVALALVRREVEIGAAVEIRWEGGSVGATAGNLPLDDFTED